ncbi:hypothetical protein DAPPUDRAFT_240133 [Daphnia pulex]|uniref:Uncharacterized protein n=1 Tax=Daphnia pulex TaxID=6669 RepID=E9GAY5_DAPPU|nr:hypothetical protein DAPPUDRAFT_240133 [Daphnia pulex]|eukprot:EFX83342.1 hypothetical protein DAPPUDRAFT_240133 [Daphnia pulex]
MEDFFIHRRNKSNVSNVNWYKAHPQERQPVEGKASLHVLHTRRYNNRKAEEVRMRKKSLKRERKGDLISRASISHTATTAAPICHQLHSSSWNQYAIIVIIEKYTHVKCCIISKQRCAAVGCCIVDGWIDHWCPDVSVDTKPQRHCLTTQHQLT